MVTVSLCMIARNEEKDLATCLSSVQDVVDEVIVVDTGSRDDTKKVARSFNARVFDFEWCDDFSAARNESLSHATGEWILVLDADEVLDENGKEELRKLVLGNENSDEKVFGYKLDQLSYLRSGLRGAQRTSEEIISSAGSFGEEIEKYPFVVSKRLVRLFRNKCSIVFKHRVHELVEDSMREKELRVEDSGIRIHHFGHVKGRSKEQLRRQQEEKEAFYVDLIYKQLQDDPYYPRYNYQAARFFLDTNNLSSALHYFLKVVEVDSSYKKVLCDVAHVYVKMGDMENAVLYFERALALYPEDMSIYNNLSVCLLRQNKKDKARQVLEKALKIDPTNKALLHNYEAVKN